MLIVASYAYGMYDYPLLRRNFRELNEKEREAYAEEMRRFRASPEHARQLVDQQVGLYKEVCGEAKRKEQEKNK